MWNVALSTMWAIGRFDHLQDFFPTATSLGFAHQELNHQVTASMLDEVDPSLLSVVSVHEPCPTEVSKEVRKANNYVISAVDESQRRTAIGFVKEAITLAHRLGAKAVIVHPGEVDVDKGLELRMRELYVEEQEESPEYEALRSQFIRARASKASPHLEVVMQSLQELAGYAESLGISLGIENRDHYYEIPLLDEVDELLSIDPDTLGYWHDTGHAQKLEHLGFFSHREWLSGFSDRMIGIHLHDIDGLRDHLAPGLGTMDWEMVARYLPAEAMRTFEVRGHNTPEEIMTGARLLVDKGILERMGPGGQDAITI